MEAPGAEEEVHEGESRVLRDEEVGQVAGRVAQGRQKGGSQREGSQEVLGREEVAMEVTSI